MKKLLRVIEKYYDAVSFALYEGKKLTPPEFG
jgi:hypothetical protein